MALLCLLFCPVTSPIQGEEPGSRPPRLVLVSWDGAADWMVDEMLEAGKLPHLAALARRGVRADHSVTSFPSKTAVGHATLWTGCWPSVHGVSGNSVPRVPRADHTVLEAHSGFSSEALTAEPLYVTAAKAGRRVVVLSATQSYPETRWVEELRRAGVPSDRYVSVSGFEHRIAPGRMLTAEDFGPASEAWDSVAGSAHGRREAVFQVGDSTFFALAYNQFDDPKEGLDRILIRQGSRRRSEAVSEIVVPPREAIARQGLRLWPQGVRVASGDLFGKVWFRLFELAPDGSSIALYQRAASGLAGALSAERLEEYAEVYTFHDDPFWFYEDGGFGPTLAEGGDGTAEERVLELVALDAEFQIGGTRWAFRELEPDVLFHYSPMVDSAGHVWLGLLDPDGPRYDPAVAVKIRRYYERVYEEMDRWLGALVEAAGEDAVVVVVSDHGMAPTHKTFFPNRALLDAGLAAVDQDGAPDLSKTKILAPPFGYFYLVLNGTHWRHGVVTPEEREAVLRRSEEVLLSVRDPETGRPVVTRVFRPEELPGLGIGGPRGGDLYFDLASGYYASPAPHDRVIGPARTPGGRGSHGFWPERRDMHAIFYAAGPGLAQGVEIPSIRHVDVAPTLAQAVGLPAPADACGHVVGEALALENRMHER